ncbi:acyl CoA:acetate/3-ketoacid CoA transferase [Bacilliculturomica massiliensis]|uniref:acyl CoA:acetate/3-ketoacid CoA transferase n=1 Tax=Bacilliculturomica massiliensis TaxID=1917867 RepID=UPI00103192A4|nr:CoA-transferase [Bacilliculturomica massiliensis]
MKKVRVMTAAEAAELVRDGQTVVTGGFVGSSCPEALSKALEQRFLETGKPEGLTLFYAAAQGNRDGSGADHFAHRGMVKRVIGGHWNMVPNLGTMVINNEIEGYNLPQGTISQMFRDIAGKRPGTITHVGLQTFVDPRISGGKLNEITTEDLVEVIEIAGQERLLYKNIPVDMAFIRGSYADELGNVSVEREIGSLDATAIAQACHNCGGKVIVQVERIVSAGTLDPRLVKIPRIYVDGVVVAEPADHEQCFGHAFDPSLTGELRKPLSDIAEEPLSAKKIIARRAALELREDAVVNLGIGAPEYIAKVANEEGIGDEMVLTVEAGPIGGVPMGGSQFGASVNPEAIMDQAIQFDFYDGGGVDLAFLGLAEADESGNINVSKFGPRIAGAGGFINITQNAKKVFFCGTFTAGGLKETIEDGRLTVVQEGRQKKFVKTVEQITFSGSYAVKTGQPVLYITERAVFELRADGMYLTEIAPGIDLENDILAHMDFVPKMEGTPVLMADRIFREDPMDLG